MLKGKAEYLSRRIRSERIGVRPGHDRQGDHREEMGESTDQHAGVRLDDCTDGIDETTENEQRQRKGAIAAIAPRPAARMNQPIPRIEADKGAVRSTDQQTLQHHAQ